MESALRAADLADAADARFYRVSGIGVATLLGGLLGGGIVLSKNFQALGQPDRARKVLISCALGMVALLGIAFMLPDSIDLPGTGFTIVQIAVLYQYAKQTQEVDIAAHMEKGGAMHSNCRRRNWLVGVACVGCNCFRGRIDARVVYAVMPVHALHMRVEFLVCIRRVRSSAAIVGCR